MNTEKKERVRTGLMIGTKAAIVVMYDNDTADVLIDCESGALLRVPMTYDQYTEWRGRARLNQDIFPELAAEVREALISGTTPVEWQALFGRKPYTKEQLVAFGYEFEG